MKKYMLIASCALLLLAAGCKSQSDNEPSAPQPSQQQLATLYGNIERPAWVVSPDYDLTSSMTAVVRVNLKEQFPALATDFVLTENDLLGAFSGETCLGAITPEGELFFLYIAGPAAGGSSSVTLRYYSAHYKNLFEAKDAFPFKNDTQVGTVSTPFVPSLGL